MSMLGLFGAGHGVLGDSGGTRVVSSGKRVQWVRRVMGSFPIERWEAGRRKRRGELGLGVLTSEREMEQAHSAVPAVSRLKRCMAWRDRGCTLINTRTVDI